MHFCLNSRFCRAFPLARHLAMARERMSRAWDICNPFMNGQRPSHLNLQKKILRWEKEEEAQYKAAFEDIVASFVRPARSRKGHENRRLRKNR